MSKIRLANIRRGQVFFEVDGSYTSKLRAMESTRTKGTGLYHCRICKCKVVDGLALGDTIELIEPLDAEPRDGRALLLYDREHLDLPPIKRRPWGSLPVVPANQDQLNAFAKINDLDLRDMNAIVDESQLRGVNKHRTLILLPGWGTRPNAVAAVDAWKWRKGETAKLDSSLRLPPELEP